MIKGLFFGVVTLLANVWLMSTFLCFTTFLSSQTIQENKADSSTLTLFTIDACLVILFMIQHSLLATKTYKAVLTDLGLQPVARSLYILTTAAILQVLMSFWQPITEVRFWLLDTGDRPLSWLFFHLLHWVLWCLLVLQVLMLEPLYMVGIKQVYYYIKGWYNPIYDLHPRLRQLLNHMPHPGSGCFIAVLWVHPCMTFDRMILATVLTAYLCCGYSVTETDYGFVKTYSETKCVRQTAWGTEHID